jgi:hypothetical protein
MTETKRKKTTVAAAESKPQKVDEKVQSVKPRKSFRVRWTRSNIVTAALVVLLVCVSAYFYNRSRQAELQLSGDNVAAQQAVKRVVKKVSGHMILPTDEQPTLATVSDVTKVRDQPFFTHAQNGDQVLVYTQTRKAILYRPSADRIVEVAPLSVNSVQQSEGIK